MKHYTGHSLGVDQGDIALFSDFEDDGEMWTGTGPRERRKVVKFASEFKSEPVVHVSVSLWDVDSETPLRAEVVAENVTLQGFDAVFRTWADTRVARLRVAWFAIGELPHEDDWDVY